MFVSRYSVLLIYQVNSLRRNFIDYRVKVLTITYLHIRDEEYGLHVIEVAVVSNLSCTVQVPSLCKRESL